MKAVLDRDEEGKLFRKAGIMCIVLEGGIIKKEDHIKIENTQQEHVTLEPV